MAQAQAVARGAAKVVEVAVGQLGQSLKLRLAVDLELAFENMPRGRAAQALMRLVDRGQQFHVGRSVVALVARPPGRLGRNPPDAKIISNRPSGLRPTEAGHALDISSQKPFGAPPLKRILVKAEQALHPAVHLRAAASGKPHTLPGRKKCLDLNQTQLLCSKHADHPSSDLARSDSPFRLILHWKRV